MSSALVASQSAFAPRKEFIKQQAQQHIFALLVFNGVDILRMSNFPPNVISSLRNLFDAQKVYRGFREDAEMGVSEFILGDRVWAGKTLRTERLITLIFSTILSHNFRHVTSVAYGRIAQDTKSLVFSKPMPSGQLQPGGSTSRTHSPAVPASPLPGSEGASPSTRLNDHRTCFGISLTSKTLHVLCPPKSSMPAILSCVRTAWPRGVLSEGRPADDVYEFTLRGYSMFSNSTFDRDALVHVFALLRSLDSNGFQLITSMNLTPGLAKSRSKDLWIFDAPSDPPSPPSSGENSRQPSMAKPVEPPERVQSVSTVTTAGMAGLGAGYNAYLAPAEGMMGIQQHMRSATAPTPSPLGRDRMNSADSAVALSAQQHVRAATSPTPDKPVVIAPPASTTPPGGSAAAGAATVGRSFSVLRKPPPPTFPAGEKPKRKNSKGSFTWSLRGKSQEDGSPDLPYVGLPAEEPVHKPILDQPPPPPLNGQKSYMTSAAGTVGPLTESEYAYGYGGSTPGPGPNTNSEYLYRQYISPQPAAQEAVIYRTTPPDEHPQPLVSPTSTDEALLSANAFRGTAYSGTTDDVSGSVSPGLPQSPRSDEGHDGDRTPHAGHSPRTGSAPLPQQPEINGQSMYSNATGRPKSEKAFLGVVPVAIPPPSSYPPVPQPDRPVPPSRGESTSTILPPGGFPKTPTPTSGIPSSSPIHSQPSPVKDDRERQRLTSATSTGSNRVVGGLRGGYEHHRSASGKSAAGGAGKGWVLVNVEPNRKTSMDAAVAAMDQAALEQSRGRVGSRPTVTNVRLNSPGAEATAGGGGLGVLTQSPLDLTSPREEHHPDADEIPDSLPVSPVSETRKRSLKKKKHTSEGSTSKKGGLFGGLFKGKKERGKSSEDGTSGTEE